MYNFIPILNIGFWFLFPISHVKCAPHPFPLTIRTSTLLFVLVIRAQPVQALGSPALPAVLHLQAALWLWLFNQSVSSLKNILLE